MSLRGNGTTISMAEGDYGIVLPIIIRGGQISSKDSLKIQIKNTLNDEDVLTKSFTNIQNNTLDFKLTKDESLKLKQGTYVYSLDWYQEGEFLCNVIPNGCFIVEQKV